MSVLMMHTILVECVVHTSGVAPQCVVQDPGACEAMGSVTAVCADMQAESGDPAQQTDQTQSTMGAAQKVHVCTFLWRAATHMQKHC